MKPDVQPLILIADDDPMVRLLATETLIAAGYRVITVDNGHDAVKAFNQYTPDGVILDVEMPGLDGFAVCQAIRSDNHSEVPILMATGQDDVSAIHQAYDCGATDFVHKPVPWATLPYRMRYVLRNSKLLQELSSSQNRNRALLDAIPDQIFLLDQKGVVIDQISHGTRMAAVSSNSTPRTLEDLLPVAAARSAREHLQVVLATGDMQSFEYQLESGQHSYETRLVAQSDNSVMAIIRDVTERHRSEQRIKHLAYFDSVTGLPNRQLFVRELRRGMQQAKRTNKLAAVVYIDLDRFKRINDTFGHSVGDALLKSVATRLSNSIRSHDFVATAASPEQSNIQLARLGGDEFVALITDLDVPEQAGLIATRIRRTLTDPFAYEGRQFVVTPSIGIATYPKDGVDVETLLMNADTAMYQSKAAGRNTVRYYEASMNARSLERLELEEDLRSAMEQQQFQLHYQPKYSALTGKLTGAEALLRWHHPKRGWISPSSFIPLAEEAGLIVALGAWVLDAACRQLRVWHEMGWNDMCVAVNISAEQIAHDDISESVLKSIWAHGVRPQYLELELTESLLMRDVNDAKTMLKSLKDAGIRLSIDDFGTGYSSLSYLRHFPLDALKIDRSFVQNLHKDADDAAICSAIIAMGKKLGLKIIAEGVELEEQLSYLRDAGCDEIQGFLLGRPKPAGELTRGNAFIPDSSQHQLRK